MAYAIGRKVGGAVQRNLIRRRLRAAAVELGRSAAPPPTGDCLVVVRPDAVDLGYAELRDALGAALRRAAGRSREDRAT